MMTNQSQRAKTDIFSGPCAQSDWGKTHYASHGGEKKREAAAAAARCLQSQRAAVDVSDSQYTSACFRPPRFPVRHSSTLLAQTSCRQPQVSGALLQTLAIADRHSLRPGVGRLFLVLPWPMGIDYRKRRAKQSCCCFLLLHSACTSGCAGM